MSFDVASIRNDFPILTQQVYGKPLVYLDNAATTQKPHQVIDAVGEVYRKYNSNIHRGTHHLSNVSTQAFEDARKKVAEFIKAPATEEVIFTKGTTEAINLVAASLGTSFLKKGDEVILTQMEHHANIVPWQLLEKRVGIVLRVVPVSDQGVLDMEAFKGLFNEHTKLVTAAHVSNVLGTINPVKEMIQIAHAHKVPILIDGAQAIHHLSVDVKALDCDFYVFSGHKMYGPTGIGVLYGKKVWLEKMEPYQGGGEMIGSVSFSGTTFNELPYKFEAGTPNYAGAIGLGAAIDYLSQLGLEDVWQYEHELFLYAKEQLKSMPHIRLIGEAADQSGVQSFLLGNAHPFDVGTLLDKLGIAVRTGHHCAQPLMEWYGIPGTVRASFAFYNTFQEIDALVNALKRVSGMLL
jgi:cysteine desulfurase/selenocysteine lyase